MKLYLPRFYGDGESKPVKSGKAAPGSELDEAVLVLEDNDDVRAYSVMILSELGYRVLQAADGENALEEFSAAESGSISFSPTSCCPGRAARSSPSRRSR